MSRCRFAVWGLALLTVVALTLPAKPAEAVKLGVNDDYFVNLHFLAQPQFKLTSSSMGTDPAEWTFFLRRARFIMLGQVSKWVTFFVETDAPNWGKGGDWSPGTFIIQDAFATFQVHDAFRVSVGMLLLPFSRHFRQSAVSLVTLDYHIPVARYPGDSTKVWRSMGVEFGGVVLDSRLDYRVSITNGSPSGTTPGDGGTLARAPRITGRIGTNILDPDAGFFFGGTSLGKKKVLSGGFAFDVQPHLFGENDHYYALSGDLVLDMPINDLIRISGQAAFLHFGGDKHLGWNKAPADPTVAPHYVTDSAAAILASSGGTGILFDFGLGIGNWQPVTIMLDWFRPTTSTEFVDDVFAIHYGAAWFIHGHNATVKLDLAMVKGHGQEMSDVGGELTVQTQLFF